jgi:hypothetical protein
MIHQMHQAAEARDNGRLVYLLQKLRRKIADEVAWEEGKSRSARDHAYIPRCMRSKEGTHA